MVIPLLLHKWKQSFRSTFFAQGIGIKLLLGFLSLYFLLIFGGLGFILPELLEKSDLPGSDVGSKFTSLLIYYFLVDVTLRFFLENLSVIQARHYLLLNIPKSSIFHYLLGGSLFSFFNLLFLILILPSFFREIVLTYSLVSAIAWLLGMIGMMLLSHYTAIYIKRSSVLHAYFLFGLLGIVSTLVVLDAFSIISLTTISHFLLSGIASTLWVWIILFLLVGLMYRLNYRLLATNIYEDKWLEITNKQKASLQFSFLEQRGILGTLIAQELKLIFRNKRTRNVFWVSVFFLFYGLIFYTSGSYGVVAGGKIFVGIFVTGSFLINYGQFITSWESAYWDGVLTRNISIRTYFQAKWILFAGVCILSFLVTIPYGFLGMEILLFHFVCLLFNIGFNSFLLLFTSSYYRKRIELAKSSMMNYQGTGVAQFLIVIPLMVLPILIVSPFVSFGYEYLGLGILAGFSLISLACYPIWMREIELVFKDKKYIKAEGYRQ